MDPYNYRSISTLSALAQFSEEIVGKQLMNYLERPKYLFQSRFGFRKMHSILPKQLLKC